MLQNRFNLMILQSKDSSDWAIIINPFYWTPDLSHESLSWSSPLRGSVWLLHGSWYCPWDFAVRGRFAAARGIVRGILQSEGLGKFYQKRGPQSLCLPPFLIPIMKHRPTCTCIHKSISSITRKWLCYYLRSANPTLGVAGLVGLYLYRNTSFTMHCTKVHFKVFKSTSWWIFWHKSYLIK